MNKKKKGLSRLPDGAVRIGFSNDMVELPIVQISPLKVITDDIQSSPKYQQILSSIREVGIIEPPVVTPDGSSKRYILLDGHLRLRALKELGADSVTCLVSSDDEAFTYNKHVNRISPIQEHRMIVRAVERGVPEERIAKALNLDVARIVLRRNLLNGICQEAADLLKDKMVAIEVFPILRRMDAYRQIEAVQLMETAQNHSVTYAKMLLVSTPQAQLVEPDKPKKMKGLTDDQIIRMESEMASLQREYQLIEETLGADVLNLTFAKAYLTKLLENARVSRYLAQHHSEIFHEFQKITKIKSLGGEAAA